MGEFVASRWLDEEEEKRNGRRGTENGNRKRDTSGIDAIGKDSGRLFWQRGATQAETAAVEPAEGPPFLNPRLAPSLLHTNGNQSERWRQEPFWRQTHCRDRSISPVSLNSPTGEMGL